MSLEDHFPIMEPHSSPLTITWTTVTASNESIDNDFINSSQYESWDYAVYGDEPIETNNISSLTLLLMSILYGAVVFGGTLSNVALVLTLCSIHSVRLRNPLLLAVCTADLLVTGVSAPVTLLNVALHRKRVSLPVAVCKSIHFLQVMPVAASTLSFFLLSLDRYATVKHSRSAQLRQRRYLHVSLAVFSWFISALISAPFLFTYKLITKTIIIKNASKQSVNISTVTSNPIFHDSRAITENVNQVCYSGRNDSSLFVLFILFHTFVVYILPGVGVLLNHYGVRQKLCALSLTARARHGELLLPMPILRRKTHMVIVTGVANAKPAGCGSAGTTDDISNDVDIQMQTLQPSRSSNMTKSVNPISPRAMREIRAHSQRQRLNYRREKTHGGGRRVATPGIPLPQTSTLRSRRHLANLLIASALIFIGCWAPHVFCILYNNLGNKEFCSKTSTYFNLLLGYMYSAISPLIYWALNHNTLRQSPCAPLIRIRSLQKFLNSRFRSKATPPAPSSTNEAALGAFNPKLIKLTPKQYRNQASSHYFY